MHPSLANRKLETSYRNGFIACSLSHGHMDIPRSCWVHGVVALLRMIRTVRPRIFGRRWKTTIAGRSPTLSLASQIGRWRGNFLGLSVMFLLQRTMHEALEGEAPTEQGHGAACLQPSLLPRSRFRQRRCRT